MKDYIRKNKRSLAAWMFFEICFAGLMVIWSLIISWALEAGMNGEVEKLKNILLGGIVFFITMVLSFYLQNYFYAKFISDCTFDFRKDLFQSVISMNANSYTEYNCARYLSIFNNDIPIIVRDYFAGFPAIFAQLFLATIATVTLFFYNVYLAVFELILSILTCLIPVFVNKNGGELQKAYTQELETYNAKIKDFISAGSVLKSYHVEEQIQKVHLGANQKVRKAYLINEKKRGMVYAVITAVRYIEGAMFLVYGSYLIAVGKLSVAMMLGAMQIVAYVANPVKQSANLYTNYTRTRTLVKSLRDFMTAVEQNQEVREELEKPLPLSIENLEFSYSEKQILKNLNVKFEAGKKYAIVGESGSGKSTLIKLITQQLEDYTGTIRFGSQECRNVNRESLVKHYAVIQQEVILFDDTLKNNITMYEEYTEEEILAAVAQAGLKKYLEGLEDGLNTVIGENGMKCSGGERQRITIARALLRKTSVLIMDEATSNLDAVTAGQIEELLLSNESLTLISITHRQSKELWNKYDKVYRMEDGCLHSVD